MSMKILNKFAKSLKNANTLLFKKKNFTLQQYQAFHLTASCRDSDEKDDDLQGSVAEIEVDNFTEHVNQTLVPIRLTEKRPSISFYDQVEFYGSPKHKTIVLFPADAYLGMCKRGYEIPRVKDMYDAASQYLGIDMYRLSCKGPLRELAIQTFQQPAVFLASLAASEKLRYENPIAVENCVATAGYSIGELTALVFAGALSFEEGLRLAMLRGEAMFVASEQVEGGIMKIHHQSYANIQLACQYAIEVCKVQRGDVIACDVAGFLSAGVKLVGGNALALRYIKTNEEGFNITKSESISSSGAFHTPLMNTAVQPFKKYVVNMDFEDPLIPVYANDTGEPYESGDDIRKRFGEQICKPVRWEDIIFNIYKLGFDDLSETYICGPSKFLMNSLWLNDETLVNSCFSVEI